VLKASGSACVATEWVGVSESGFFAQIGSAVVELRRVKVRLADQRFLGEKQSRSPKNDLSASPPSL